MSIISTPYIFAAGATIIAAQHNSNFSTIVNDYNGNITYINLAASAGILGTQLSASANILGSQLSASAGISGTQITSLSATQLTGNVPLGVLASGTALPNYGILSNGTNCPPVNSVSCSEKSFILNSAILLYR